MDEPTGCIFYAWQGKAMRAGFERKPPPGKHSHKKVNNMKMGFKEYKWSLYTRYVWL